MSEERKGPWINASHAAIVQYSPAGGPLVAVRCPGVACNNTVVALEGGAIAAHNNPMDFAVCTWSGVGIHDDRQDWGPHVQR